MVLVYKNSPRKTNVFWVGPISHYQTSADRIFQCTDIGWHVRICCVRAPEEVVHAIPHLKSDRSLHWVVHLNLPHWDVLALEAVPDIPCAVADFVDANGDRR